MSLKWREWIRLKKKKDLGISESDYNTLQENIGHFCRISDELIREAAGDDANINKEFDELPEEQKLDHTREVIKKGIAKLKKKKKIEEEESESQKSYIETKQQTEKVQNETNKQTSTTENP